MIKFKEDTELTVISGYDEETDNITEECQELFKAGENVDADIYDDDGGKYVNLQFGDGSIVLTVQRNCFEMVD